MKIVSIKSKVITFAREYLEKHAKDSHDGHVHQDKAKFLIEALPSVNNAVILLSLLEHVHEKIPEWSPLLKGTINFIASSLFAKAAVGSTLKQELTVVINELKKKVNQNTHYQQKYQLFVSQFQRVISCQLEKNYVITEFDIRNNDLVVCYSFLGTDKRESVIIPTSLSAPTALKL